MKFNNRISARALLAVATLAVSPSAWSLGLGDATVESYLNQPLRARIDLISQESDDLASVSAKLASAADYELIGASLEDVSVPIRFSVENIDGDAYLMASSQLPLNSPVVRLIVEVNWASGRMLREYTLFLDPPMVSDQAPPPPVIDQREPDPVSEPAAAPPPSVTRAPAEEPVAEREPEPEAAASTPAPAREPVRVPTGDEYGPVASGETLWGIAKNWSAGTGMNINKVMIAIQRENPQAFMNDNINLLKRGAILRMPEVSEVERISSSVAYNEVATQEQEFYGRQAEAPVYSPSTPLLSEDAAATEDYSYTEPDPEPESAAEPEQGVSDQPPEADTATAELAESTDTEAEEPVADVAAEEATGAVAEEGRLELLPPSEASDLDSTYGFEESEEDGNAAFASEELRESLARTEEDLIAQQQQNEYLEERIRELESRLEEAEKASVADSDLAGMEQRLREERTASQTADVEKPWYQRLGVWLLGVLVVVAAGAAWLFGRRKDEDVSEETIQEIKDEAEELLRVLDDKEEAGAESEPETDIEENADDDAAGDESGDDGGDEGGDEEAPVKPDSKPAPTARFGGAQDEADFLDTDSSDPEIQLDLARAYISMGDKEAARVILEEVASNGNEEQQAEAQKMLDLM
jgi:pilus assembly protein FimV